ncbi:MAG: M48 family metallopeptidase [Lachnospiraceae bacterium]|nr:M48 family metallopeptidase [Lachnospiraceae bacterium]
MEDAVEYKLIRSSRKTIGIEVTPEGVTVRAPYRTPVGEIDEFVISNREWIRKHTEKVRLRKEENIQRLSKEEIDELADRALKVIPERVKYYAPLVGVTYGRITIRNQRSRWGSCSAKGNLNFNCLLMLAPEGVIDAVVVHELCHRLEMNHSERFYENVYRVFPEYRKYDIWLRKYGGKLMRRMTG